MAKKQSRIPGLRQRNGIWHIQKRCRYAPGGWLHESTGTPSRAEAERILIRRLAQLEEEAARQAEAIYLFEQAALQYLEEVAEKSSADTIAMHLDQLLPFIGNLPLAHVHDGTIAPFIKHERARGLAPKSINNALGCVATILNRAARVWRDEAGRPWLSQAPAKISRLPVKGKQAKSYPVSWAEQTRLIQDMPRHLADPVLFGINTGCREQEICQLRWDWEVAIPNLETSVFILPEKLTKNSDERIVVLNAVAREGHPERGAQPASHLRSTPPKCRCATGNAKSAARACQRRHHDALFGGGDRGVATGRREDRGCACCADTHTDDRAKDGHGCGQSVTKSKRASAQMRLTL